MTGSVVLSSHMGHGKTQTLDMKGVMQNFIFEDYKDNNSKERILKENPYLQPFSTKQNNVKKLSANDATYTKGAIHSGYYNSKKVSNAPNRPIAILHIE